MELIAVITAIMAQMSVYCGLLFMAGKLFPKTLQPIYEFMPLAYQRLGLATLSFILIGNVLFQRLYTSQPVIRAGILTLVSGVLIVNISGLIIERKLPNFPLVLGLLLVMSGGVIAIYARDNL
jgi:intracellular septation protein A